MKVCIIGAGASGITSAKTLKDFGIDFDVYEKGSKPGGLWLYGNDNGQSSIYKTLHINTSKQMMAYSDFPFPEDYPDYPHHSLIYQYFEKYVDNFGIRDKILFKTIVEKIEKTPEGKYNVTSDKYGTRIYDAVIVASGHHWNPKFAEFPGKFTGKTMHAHDYKTTDGFEDKRVLVIGIGNSAVDIACDVSNVAKRTVISTRSGAYIVPKYLFGKPTDHISKPPLAYMPLGFQRKAMMASLLLNIGKQDNYGVPSPKRPILSEHPTVSQELLGKVGHGKISIKPNIKEFKEQTVEFEDGSSELFDIVVYATGYYITFPFFGPELVDVKDNEINLYHKVVHSEHQNLFFIGFIQPLGAIMPLSEIQAKWVASILSEKSKLPSKEKMLKTIQKEREVIKRRYIASTRHTIQVDFYPYKRLLENEIKGKKRLGIF